MKKIISTNPSKNYEVIGKVKASTKKEIVQKVADANHVKEDWRNLGVRNRIGLVRKAYLAYKKNQEKIAGLITKEVGTPITECKDEVAWNWSYIDWFLEHVESAIKDEITYDDGKSLHKIIYEPLGTAVVITPWNLPFDLFIWGVIPNLLVGNTVVYKAAAECVLTGKLLEEISSKVGFPKGVFSFIHGDSQEGKFLTEQDIDLVWFTGSTKVGRSIYELAGKKFIKALLEMGGSNPAIIFDDVDMDSLIDNVTAKRFMFCGQTCDADKRIIVHENKYDEFIEKVEKKLSTFVIGDPEDSKTTMGPLVSIKQLNLLISQVDDAINKGAKVVYGGKRPKGLKGAYYLPTILTDIKRNMKVWNEEVFGPVLPIMTFRTEEEAVYIANDTVYGLGSQVFTKDKNRIKRISGLIDAGNIDFNGVGHFKPFNPFGGYKHSGMGREHGIVGFRELCQIKTVSMEK